MLDKYIAGLYRIVWCARSQARCTTGDSRSVL